MIVWNKLNRWLKSRKVYYVAGGIYKVSIDISAIYLHLDEKLLETVLNAVNPSSSAVLQKESRYKLFSNFCKTAGGEC